MNELKYYEKRLNDQQLTENEVINLIDEVTSLKKNNTTLASSYLYVIARYVFKYDKRGLINSVIYLIDNFAESMPNVETRRNVFEAMVVAYYNLPFYPKALEAGLNLIKIGFNPDPVKQASILNCLCSICDYLKMYDKAHLYNDSFYQIIEDSDLDENIKIKYKIVYLNNGVYICIKEKMFSLAKEYIDELNDFAKEIKYHKLYDIYFRSIPFVNLYYEFHTNKKVDINSYIEFITSYLDLKQTMVYSRLTVNDQIPFLRYLINNGKINEAIDIINKLVKSELFTGEKNELLILLLEIYRIDGICKNKECIEKVLQAYNYLVKEYESQKNRISYILAAEEFKIDIMRSNIEDLKGRYIKDELTNCLNRYGLKEIWPSLVNKETDIVVVFADLDHLKKINDSFGHKYGDEYLKTFSKIIQDNLAAGENIYRWGGDEFIVTLNRKSEDAMKFFKTIGKKCHENGNKIVFSYGLSVYHEDSDNLEELIKVADKRMYKQKREKKCIKYKK